MEFRKRTQSHDLGISFQSGRKNKNLEHGDQRRNTEASISKYKGDVEKYKFMKQRHSEKERSEKLLTSLC